MGPQTGRKSLANHQSPFTARPTRPFSGSQPSERVPGKNCNSIPTNYYKWDKMTYDVGYLIFDICHVIFDMRCTSYRIYDDICILSTIIWILFHSCQISNTFLCPNPGIHAPCLGRWQKSNLRGGLTTNPIFTCKDLVNQSVVFDSKKYIVYHIQIR